MANLRNKNDRILSARPVMVGQAFSMGDRNFIGLANDVGNDL